MNQDFALLATPANARRLVLLGRVCKITIPSNITQLAVQDTLDKGIFDPLVCPFNIVKYTVAQFLLDNDLRGVVQMDYHPEINPLTLLNIVRVTKPNLIVIVSDRHKVWAVAATALGIGVQLVSSLMALDNIDRHAVIVYDCQYTGAIDNISVRSQNVMREFSRVLIFDRQRGFDHLMYWTVWARLLFPSMPHPLYPRMIANVPLDWQKQQLSSFALCYNTCIFPHLISTPSVVAALGEEYFDDRMNYYELLAYK